MSEVNYVIGDYITSKGEIILAKVLRLSKDNVRVKLLIYNCINQKGIININYDLYPANFYRIDWEV